MGLRVVASTRVRRTDSQTQGRIDAMTHFARRFFVSGDVQGVGFRYFVLREAQRIGDLGGFVRNLRDGRVEVYAEGEEQKLAELEHAVRRGPRGASVANLEVHHETPEGRHDVFRITF